VYVFNYAMHATCPDRFLLLDLTTLKMFTVEEEPLFSLFSHTKIGCIEARSYVLQVKLIHPLLFILSEAVAAYVVVGVPSCCVSLAIPFS
jgi:hypothetical protein